MKPKSRDNRIPESFVEACKIPNWAEDIDREYNAMVDRGTWEYLKLTPDMQPIPFIRDFRTKHTAESIAPAFYRARCSLRGAFPIAYLDFDPINLYAPVVRHETIRIFLIKASAQGLFFRGADVTNA